MTDRLKELLKKEKEMANIAAAKENKETALKEKVSAPSGKEDQPACCKYIRESARILLVIVGILTSLPNIKQKKGANLAKSVPSHKTKTSTVKERSVRWMQQPLW